MTIDDIPDGQRLRALAGWNQTESDWRRLLELEPEGCFVACIDGAVRGTVTTTSYEKRFGWVGMVLVDPDFRRHGMGTQLLLKGIEYLEQSGVETVKLDATPMGKLVYDRIGFVEEYLIERWEGAAPADYERALEEIKHSDWEKVLELDKRAFGADRSRLVERLYRDYPELSAVAYKDGQIAGYALGRRGMLANYLGPWVAIDKATAQQLFQSVISMWPRERFFVDVNLASPCAKEIAAGYGLTAQRPLIRMYRGPNNFPGEPQLVCGIAGPEIG